MAVAAHKQQPAASAFVRRIDCLIRRTEMTQRAIAAFLGYSKPNIITMFKQGHTRVPLAKVPLLADCLGVERLELVHLWLTAYEPEMLEVIESSLGVTCTKREREWLIHLRRSFGGVVRPWDELSRASVEFLAEDWRDACGGSKQ